WRMAFGPSKSLDREERSGDDASRVHNFSLTLSECDAGHCRGRPDAARARRIDVQTQDRRSGGFAGIRDLREIARDLLCVAHFFSSQRNRKGWESEGIS